MHEKKMIAKDRTKKMKKTAYLILAMLTGCISSYAQRGNVDTHVAVNDLKDENTFVVIVANENYQFEEPVPFALNDGATFKLYCEKTLGIPEQNIKMVQDATLNVMKFNLKWLERIMQVKKGEARCLFYYSGHGMPDEDSKKAYLLPVDGFSTEPSSGFSTADLYQQLGSMPSKGTLVLLDACFSGAKREGGMMKSSRGVALKAKNEPVSGNMVVFSAAQGNETAYPLKDKEHGMFTYYLLEKLQETGGGITLGELSDYVIKQVAENSLRENDKSQTPSVVASLNNHEWRNWPLAGKAATQYVNFPKQLGNRKATAMAPTPVAKAEKNQTLDLSGGGAFSLAGVTVEMARVDGATFTMGQQNVGNTFSTFSMNMPAHQVKLKAYAISKTEVTQELWQAVMGSNPSETKDAQRPVENVTWDECQTFIRRLNQLCGMKFRLPTEAEWEYAAQCSSKYAASGIQHMTDGVDEWCQDYYARYTQMNQQNPQGPSMGYQRVVRGGGNSQLNKQERMAQRGHMKADKKSASVGLRLAHDL